MAGTTLVRVSGSVLSVPPARRGFIKTGPRQGEEWVAESVNVLVADQNVTAVRLPFRDSTGTFEGLETRSVDKGEYVDFLCEASVYGQDVQLRAVALFPADADAEFLASV